MIRWSIAIALGLLAAWFAYGRTGTMARSGAWVLGTLRALAVTIVAALLVGAPAGRARPRTPLVAIDGSASWRRAVGDDSTFLRRWRRLISDSIVAPLGDDVALVVVGDSVRDVSARDVGQFTPNDAASRVRPAVDRAASLGRSLVLVTDGEVDDGDALAEAPPGSRVVRLPRASRTDVAVADLAAPSSATASDTVTVSATVVSGAAATPDGVLRFLLDGAEVASRPVPALAPFGSTRLTVPVTLARGARTSLLQAVVQVPTDAEPRNDTLGVAIDVGDRPTAVFVSTAPDLDVREALTVLRGALDVPTRAYLRVAPSVWRVEGSLTPISEAEVKARAAGAGMLIVHGDTAWRPATAVKGATTATARALWVPAPPTQVARAGETARTAEWYMAATPASPLRSALAGLPFDSLPPITLHGPVRGAVPVLSAQLGKRGDAVPAVAIREGGGSRTVLISGSGYAGWSLRAGRSREAFSALWGAIFDWLAAGRGDARAARPVAGIVRAGEPIVWRRGGADSVVSVQVVRRGVEPVSARVADSVRLRFAASSFETASPSLPAGVYEVNTAGGSSVLVVNGAREWVPRAPVVSAGPLARGASGADAPRLADTSWPFVLALLLLCGEWIGRRAAGQR
ncbi:MAG: hypothetical protein ACK6DP_07990 [Gemmatimonas sp.]|uniref:hypothetical protein n=1 Tax=Gemmatimonas sp. TaxID=1962908 RepID=UPI00391F0F2D